LLQVVPILRAGLVLLEQAATLLPASETYHLGYVRDDETLQVGSDVRHHSMIASVMTALGCHSLGLSQQCRLGLHQGR
jgi:uracil phosphoribosyltransferase